MSLLLLIVGILFLGGLFAINAKWKSLPTIKKLVVGTAISVAIVFVCTKLVGLSESKKREAEQAKVAQQQIESQMLQRTIAIAKNLRQSLHKAGISDELITDVKVAENSGHIIVQVTNLWLSRPEYEQKQMHQTIELLLKKIAPPDGHRFAIVDYMGNWI